MHMEKTPLRKRIDFFPYLMCAPAVLLFTLFVVTPFLIGIYTSLHNWDGLSAMKWVGLNNYKFVLQDKLFWLSLQHTFVYAITVTVFKNLFGLGLALLLQKKVVGLGLFRTAAFMPVTFSYIVIGVLWSWIYNPNFGILNALLSALGLESLIMGWLSDSSIALFSVAWVDIWKWTGLHMVLYLAGLQGISQEYYEAAAIDGAGKLQQFRRITIPLLNSTIMTNLLLSLLGAFCSNYDLVRVMTGGGPYHSTEVVASYMVTTATTNFALGKANAISLLLFICVFIFGFLQIKLMTRDQNYDD